METKGMFQSIGTKERLVDRVVGEIQGQILDGGLPPGSMLPSERELCEQLGVSRTALREAVRMLVTKGLLETRPGVGTVVKQIGSDQISESIGFMLSQDKNLTLLHLHNVRRMLETEIAKLAARNANEANLARLREIMAEMEKALDDPEEFSLLDAEFHRALADSTQNPLLGILLDSIRDLFLDIIIQVQVRTHQVENTLPEHNRIIAEVANRQPERAAEAMRIHLENALQIMRERLVEEDADENPG
jgi:DNA-binding FadR family transcriptional regulator